MTAASIASNQFRAASRKAFCRPVNRNNSVVGGVNHRQAARDRAIAQTLLSRWCSVTEQENLRKYALECLRLAADCMDLARNVDGPSLRDHFRHMAKIWTALAEQGPDGDDARTLLDEFSQALRRTSSVN